MIIENVLIRDIKNYESNPRKNKLAIKHLVDSINAFGFKVPVIIDKDNIIVCGHTRIEAAKKLGMTEVPCIRANDLDEAQIKAFRIADNKVSEYSIWDDDLLKKEMTYLKDIDYDVLMTGFTQSDIDKILGNSGFPDSELPKGDKGDAKDIKQSHLKFGKHKIIMTDEECTDLLARYNTYVSDTGSSFGFIASILEVSK